MTPNYTPSAKAFDKDSGTSRLPYCVVVPYTTNVYWNPTTKIRCTTVKLSRVVQMTQKDTRQHRAQFYAGVTSVISIELHLNKARTNTVVRQTQYIHSTLCLWLQLKRSSSKRDVSISYVSIINSIWNHSFFLMGGNYFILEDYCIKHLSKWIYYT